MSSLIQQRRAMYEQKMQDDYPGCEFGIAIGTRLPAMMPFAMTPKVEVPSNCASLRFVSYSTSDVRALGFNGDTPSTSWTMVAAANGKLQNITAGSFTHVQMCFNIDYIDDCFIEDTTNNQYLWKGKNIV